MITRTITNTGDPIVNGAGVAQGFVKLSFTLVNEKGHPADAWDAFTGEHITPATISVLTNSSGIFSVSLWPTSRADRVVFWKCEVDLPFFSSFKSSLIDGAAPLQWFDFRFGADSGNAWTGDIGPAIGQAIAGAAVAYKPRVQSVESRVTSAESRVALLEAGQSSGVLGFVNKAAMDADLAHTAGTPALVTNDATASNNTFWIKLGASGSGSWQKSDMLGGLAHLSGLVDTYVGQTEPTDPLVKYWIVPKFPEVLVNGQIIPGTKWGNGVASVASAGVLTQKSDDYFTVDTGAGAASIAGVLFPLPEYGTPWTRKIKIKNCTSGGNTIYLQMLDLQFPVGGSNTAYQNAHSKFWIAISKTVGGFFQFIARLIANDGTFYELKAPSGFRDPNIAGAAIVGTGTTISLSIEMTVGNGLQFTVFDENGVLSTALYSPVISTLPRNGLLSSFLAIGDNLTDGDPVAFDMVLVN